MNLRSSLQLALIAFFTILTAQDVCSQDKRRIFTGISAGGHYSQISSQDYDFTAGVQWKGTSYALPSFDAALQIGTDFARRFSVLGEVGYFVDRAGIFHERIDQGVTIYQERTKDKFSWIVASANALFRPFIGESFNILTGTGFALRYSLNATHKDYSGTRDHSDRLLDWNYFIPAQAGVEFPYFNGRVIIVIEGQVCLKTLYKWQPSADTNPSQELLDHLNRMQRLSSLGVRLIYQFPLTSSL